MKTLDRRVHRGGGGGGGSPLPMNPPPPPLEVSSFVSKSTAYAA